MVNNSVTACWATLCEMTFVTGFDMTQAVSEAIQFVGGGDTRISNKHSCWW